ncbi:hypothetical protein FA95DRAFT_1483941 [Auriscalpium vulgare]|uniref:Uncharacterized protein n=1 Tax=Auriscalpium vulgare TaxID=40419 RepID=A0ACB8S741_9AGAM|nr:hypothetical protein FA95DRAFT_1483941 [Auriscalpium vulgare]
MPLSQYPSQYNSRRSRRASTSGAYAAKEPYQYDGMQVKFRVKGSHRNGISLSEAVGNVRLSSSNAYTFRDLNTDSRGRVRLIVRWTGYRSGSYEIPISGYSDGRTVDLQSLARRITRGVVHFLSANHISIPWDRVVLHRLEETSVGTWMPVLTTY